MSSPRAGIALRPELARSGLLNSMMGKSLRKIGRDSQPEQCKKSAYMGRRRFWFI
jgi:predicted acetyltransferase